MEIDAEFDFREEESSPTQNEDGTSEIEKSWKQSLDYYFSLINLRVLIRQPTAVEALSDRRCDERNAYQKSQTTEKEEKQEIKMNDIQINGEAEKSSAQTTDKRNDVTVMKSARKRIIVFAVILQYAVILRLITSVPTCDARPMCNFSAQTMMPSKSFVAKIEICGVNKNDVRIIQFNAGGDFQTLKLFDGKDDSLADQYIEYNGDECFNISFKTCSSGQYAVMKDRCKEKLVDLMCTSQAMQNVGKNWEVSVYVVIGSSLLVMLTVILAYLFRPTTYVDINSVVLTTGLMDQWPGN